MDSPDSRNTEEHDKYAVVSVPTNSFCDSDIIGHMPQKINYVSEFNSLLFRS